MAVSIFLGKTGSGKSYKANVLSKKYDRLFVFDNAHCFQGDLVTDDLSTSNLVKIMRRFALKEKFRVIFRPNLKTSPKESCETVAQFLFAHFGTLNKKLSKKDRILFLVDEADKVSSLKDESWIYKMVTMGRHQQFDCFGIAQGPGRLPKYWRDNASEVFCFKVMEHDFLKMVYGQHAKHIPTLGQYECLHWVDSGDVSLVNKSGKSKTI